MMSDNELRAERDAATRRADDLEYALRKAEGLLREVVTWWTRDPLIPFPVASLYKRIRAHLDAPAQPLAPAGRYRVYHREGGIFAVERDGIEICRCHDEADAERIKDALNAMHKEATE